MNFKIKNGYHRTQAFKVFGGSEDVKPGETKVIDIEGDVSEDFIDRMKARGVKMTPMKDEAKQDGELKAVHHGGGKFKIVKGDDVLLSGLSKADADAFNAMSEEDKAAFASVNREN